MIRRWIDAFFESWADQPAVAILIVGIFYVMFGLVLMAWVLATVR